MRKTLVTIISIFIVAYYIFITLIKTDFHNQGLLTGFWVFMLPYILRSLVLAYFLIYSLIRKSKDVDDSDMATIISTLGANLSAFVGIFIGLQSQTPNTDLLFWGTVLSLAVFPFFFVGLFTLGYNLTVLPEANTLKTNGIYSISRHPLYVCYNVWFVLQNLICQTWIMAVISIIQIYIQIVRARYEERILEKNFPEYADYKARVGWLGRKKVNQNKKG